MLKTTLIGILTTAMLSAISLGTETLFPASLVKDQGTAENNTVSSTESVAPSTDADENNAVSPTEGTVPSADTSEADTSENIICDYCLSNAGGHGHGHHYIDANGDGICDNYTTASGSESSSGTACPAGYGANCPSGYGADCPAGYGSNCPSGYGADCPLGYDTETRPHHNSGHENGHHRGNHR